MQLSRRLAGTIAAIVLAAAIKLQPAIGPLDPVAQSALAIITMAVVFWVVDAWNEPDGVTAILALGLLIGPAAVPSSVALGVYATGAFWTCHTVSTCFFGTAMQRPGSAGDCLAPRPVCVSPYLLGGISSASAYIRFVLAFGSPSIDR